MRLGYHDREVDQNGSVEITNLEFAIAGALQVSPFDEKKNLNDLYHYSKLIRSEENEGERI